MSTVFEFSKEPLAHFLSLYEDAVKTRVPEPNAMVLSTVGLDGKPTSRVVLYKQIIRGEIAFFTNYNGKKSREISENPYVCLNFFWPTLERQIRIEGRAEKVERSESESYFSTRPRLSQIGAWASSQSEKIKSFDELEVQVKEFESRFADQTIPCPPHWGGFRVVASKFEFWFGRQGRLHERYVYEKNSTGWERYFLSP